MAGYYVQSGASGSADGSTWANAFTTIALAIAKPIVAGDVLWVSDTHAESTGSAVTWTFPGTLASPNQVLCVNHLGSTPPVSADLRTTAAPATTTSFGFTIAGCCYFYGIQWNIGTAANNPQTILGAAVQNDLYFDHCLFKTNATSSPGLTIGSVSNSIGTRVVWDNTKYQLSGVGGVIKLLSGVDFLWKNTSAAIQGTAPTTLFSGSDTTASGQCVCDGVDFAGGTGMNGKTFIGAIAKAFYFYFKDCVYPAAYTLNSAPTSACARIYEFRSSNGANAYNVGAHDARGNQSIETTIVRTGGKTVNGTPVAMKIVGTANALFTTPFEATPIVIGNSTVGSVTVTLYGVWAGGALPNNDQVWIEVGYLASGSNPLLTFNRSTKKADVLAAGAAVATTDSSAWGGSTMKFKFTVTITTGMAGEIYVYPKVASTNATYIDPLPVLS